MSNKGFQRTELVGNVGAEDAKLGTLPSGTPVANFSLAVNESYKPRNGERKDITTWYKVSIFGKRAEALAPYITSGKTLLLAGRAGAEGWVTEKNEVKTNLTLTVGNGEKDFVFLGGGHRDEEIPEFHESEETPLLDE